MSRKALVLAALLLFACAKAPSTVVSQEPVASGPRVTFPDGFVVRVEIAADGSGSFRVAAGEQHGCPFRL